MLRVLFTTGLISGVVGDKFLGRAWDNVPTAWTSSLSVDCASGTADTSISNNSQTDKTCQDQCTASCTDLTSMEGIKNCFGLEAVHGCLYDVKVSLSQTLNSTSACVSIDSTTKELSLLGNVPAGMTVFERGEIQAYDLVATISKDSTKCTDDSVAVGTPTEPNLDTCRYTADANAKTAKFTKATDKVTFSILDLAKAADAANGINFYALFADKTCFIDTVLTKVDVNVRVTYQDGYSPSVPCESIQDCEGCMNAGCNWCDFSKTVGIVFPDWLPDWDWVQNIQNGKKGVCGLNHAACNIATGRFNQCGASAILKTGFLAFVLSLFVSHF